MKHLQEVHNIMMADRKLIYLVTKTTEMSMLIQIQQDIVKGNISQSF
jgi:hypothetical protein